MLRLPSGGMVATEHRGQDYAPGAGPDGNAVASGAGLRVRVCLRRPQPELGLSLRSLLRTCLLLAPGIISCWFNVAVAADFRVNPQEIPKSRQLLCFGEQAAKNVLARLIELRTVYKLPIEKVHDRLATRNDRAQEKGISRLFYSNVCDLSP